MDRLRGAWLRVRDLLWRRRAEREMDDELRFHVEMEAEKNVRSGVAPVEARRRAHVAFGGIERWRERLRRDRSAGAIEDAMQDVRFAMRALARNPVFTLVAVLTIALGVGATTAVASLANAVLFRPLPVREPDRLFSIREDRSGSVSTGVEGMKLPYSRYRAYAGATRDVLTGLAAHKYDAFSLRLGEEAIAVTGVLATGSYFDVLGATPAAGRLFNDDDEPAVVLGYSLWRERFGGEHGVIGRTVYVDSRPFVVVGVASRGFVGTAFPLVADLWVPFGAYQAGAGLTGHSSWLVPFGRLRAGVEPQQASLAVDAAARRIPPDERHTTVRGARLDPVRIDSEAIPLVRTFMAMLFGTGVLVLLIASANIAGMLLARSIARRREVAVRLAIGAGRGRLVRQLLTESLLLFLLGGIAGTLLAVWGTRLVSSVRLPLNAATAGFDATPDTSVLALGIGVALVTGMCFGLGPAVRASAVDVATSLKLGLGYAGRGIVRRRNLFVAAQLALAVLLLVISGLFVRTVYTALRLDPGFDADDVTIAAVDLAPHGYDEERGHAFFEQLIEQVRTQPGVQRAALARLALATGQTSGNDAHAVGTGDAEERWTNAAWNVVDTAYFATMGIELVAGRAFTAADRAGAPPVVIVNETMAQRLWPGESAIGKRLREGRNVYEVTGVTRAGKYIYMAEPPWAFAFLPLAQSFRSRMTLHVRTPTSPEATVARIERAVRSLDPNIAVVDGRALADAVATSLFPQRFAAMLTGVFGLIGLVLAAIGVYGVLAMHVAQRRREFGIRMALGASTGDVLGQVLRHGALLALGGAVIGLVLAAGATRIVRSFLFGIGALDPVTFAGVPTLLLLVALAASLVPARRATRADPLETLRAE